MGVGVTEPVPEEVNDEVFDGDNVLDDESEIVEDEDALTETPIVLLPVADKERERVSVLDDVPLGDEVDVGVPLGDGVDVELDVNEAVAVPLSEPEELLLRVPMLLGVLLADEPSVTEAVGEFDRLTLTVGVIEFVFEGVWEDVGLLVPLVVEVGVTGGVDEALIVLVEDEDSVDDKEIERLGGAPIEDD